MFRRACASRTAAAAAATTFSSAAMLRTCCAATTPVAATTNSFNFATSASLFNTARFASAGSEYKIGEINVKVINEGAGPSPRAGQRVTMHYTGYLTNEQGKKFDSSRDRGQPFSFTLGRGEVIKMWDMVVSQMKAGDRLVATAPPSLGYGARGAGGAIPPNATLCFDMELISF